MVDIVFMSACSQMSVEAQSVDYQPNIVVAKNWKMTRTNLSGKRIDIPYSSIEYIRYIDEGDSENGNH